MKTDILKTKTFRRNMTTGMIIAVMLAVSAVMLFPYLLMLSGSLKYPRDLFTERLELIPPVWKWSNYAQVLFEENLVRSIVNTFKILVWVIPLGLFTTSLASFAFAKMRFRGSTFLFALLLSTMMIPFTVTMIPQYLFFSMAGLRDSYLPLILPGCLGNISAMFFIVQYLKGLPNSLIESAKMEGASYFSIYLYIIVPLTKGAIATQGIFWVMAVWNDLMGPILYLNSTDKYPITAFIASLSTQDSSMSSVPVMLAGSVCASVPLIVIYLLFHGQIIRSLSLTGGVKE